MASFPALVRLSARRKADGRDLSERRALGTEEGLSLHHREMNTSADTATPPTWRDTLLGGASSSSEEDADLCSSCAGYSRMLTAPSGRAMAESRNPMF